jgi:hypothetical protein
LPRHTFYVVALDRQPDQMKHLKRRLRNLEAVLTDPVGLVPQTRNWLECRDQQFYLYLTGQDRNAIWYSSIAAYRAVMKYANESAASMVCSFWQTAAGQSYVMEAALNELDAVSIPRCSAVSPGPRS